MRAARRQGVLGVVRCGIGPSPRVRTRAPPARHLRGGYKRGLYAFQGEQRHHGLFLVHLKKKRGVGGAGGSNCRRVSTGDAALGYALC